MGVVAGTGNENSIRYEIIPSTGTKLGPHDCVVSCIVYYFHGTRTPGHDFIVLSGFPWITTNSSDGIKTQTRIMSTDSEFISSDPIDYFLIKLYTIDLRVISLSLLLRAIHAPTSTIYTQVFRPEIRPNI